MRWTRAPADFRDVPAAGRTERPTRKVARIHARIGGLRFNETHHLSKRIVEKASTVAIEDLNVAGMRKGRLAKSVSDVALG